MDVISLISKPEGLPDGIPGEPDTQTAVVRMVRMYMSI